MPIRRHGARKTYPKKRIKDDKATYYLALHYLVSVCVSEQSKHGLNIEIQCLIIINIYKTLYLYHKLENTVHQLQSCYD